MADLHYFAFYAHDWLSGEATSQMTPAQEGGFIRLLAHAWISKTAPCTLPDDDDALAKLSRLGREWKKLGPFIRAQFVVVDGRLRNRKQWVIYEESLSKHQRRVDAGKTGGRGNRKQSTSNDQDERKQFQSNALAVPKQPESESESESEINTKTTAAPSLPSSLPLSEEIAATASMREKLIEQLPETFHCDAHALLDRVPRPSIWIAEMLASFDGMHGPALTPQQLGQAIRDYGANGAQVSIRLFRGYMRDATRPPTRKSVGGRVAVNHGARTYENARRALSISGGEKPMIDPEAFAYWLAILADIHDRSLSEPTLVQLHHLLSRCLTTAEFEAGCQLAIQELKFWPKPSEIIAFGKPRRDASLAAAETFADLSRWSGSEPFPLTIAQQRLPAYAVRAFTAFGGPGRFHNMTLEELPFARKEFVSAFVAAEQDAMNELTLQLALEYRFDSPPCAIKGPEPLAAIVQLLPAQVSMTSTGKQ